MAELIGDPNCICQGTGLVCGLMQGPDGRSIPDPKTIEVCECVGETARKQERERMQTFVEAIKFEAGCMRHYADEKPGMLGKLAGEMVEPLEAALDKLDADHA